MSKEVSQYFDGFFLQEAIDRNKPKDYKSITASYFDRVSRELEKLLNGFKSLEDLNNLSEYTEKIVKYFTYEKYNLPEIITEDFDQKLEKEMSSNIRGEYFDKYVAHQKLYNFLYHLDNLRSETENKKWQFVLANQKNSQEIYTEIINYKVFIKQEIAEKLNNIQAFFQAQSSEIVPTRIVMSSQYLSVNAGKKESVQKLYPEINLFIEETNNSLKEASKQVRNYMKLFAKEAEEKVFLVEKNAHAILNSFLGGKAASTDPLSVIVIQRMEDDFKKELDYIAVDYVLKMLGISKNFTVLKEKVKNNFYYEGGEILREITRYESVEDEISPPRP